MTSGRGSVVRMKFQDRLFDIFLGHAAHIGETDSVDARKTGEFAMQIPFIKHMLHQFVRKILPVVVRQAEEIAEEMADDSETNGKLADRQGVFRDAVFDQTHDFIEDEVKCRFHIVFFRLELRCDIRFHIAVSEHVRIQ